jgi:Tfp pilus assembly protein PilZ
MNRRNSQRIPRRVQVLFQPRGEAQAYRCFTTDLSPQGMHVSTRHTRPPGTRLRIELLEESRGFTVEGVVAHARSVHPELAKVLPQGMGIRFLAPQELVDGILGPRGAAAEASAPETPEGVFPLHFESPTQFLEVYRRDLRLGGLFVPTRRPSRVQTEVTVELHPPDPAFSPVLLAARVVRRFDAPLAVPAGVEARIGMGVELLDPAAALERLRPIAERLEARRREE